MPQMAPLNWTLLFIFFVFLYLFISILNYYIFEYAPKIKKFFKNFNPSNWKW
uniref:ATP synthase complex subunit 8 n=1 Tax=Coleoptera sp. 3 AH-2016 TaxID=1903825 RepID=A0A343C4J2_9COLE|nr:ATP synthase F0 subunit 8 [Coleoptera sp. 3 AH-2016]